MGRVLGAASRIGGRPRGARACQGPSCAAWPPLGGQALRDRAEVDDGGRPGGLERALARADVAALARVVAVREEAEESLDAGPGAAQVLGRVGVGEHRPPSLQMLFVLGDLDRLGLGVLSQAAISERAAATESDAED